MKSSKNRITRILNNIKNYEEEYLEKIFDLKETISFRMYQNTLDYNVYGFDIEEGYTTIFTYGEIKVYCRFFDSSYNYLWNDGKYALSIYSTKIIFEDDLVKIIENIVVKK